MRGWSLKGLSDLLWQTAAVVRPDCDPFRVDCAGCSLCTGGVASLNPRLNAWTPPRSLFAAENRSVALVA